MCKRPVSVIDINFDNLEPEDVKIINLRHRFCTTDQPKNVKDNCSAELTKIKLTTPRLVYLEKSSIKPFQVRHLQSVLIFSILVYYYSFGVFLSYQTTILWFNFLSVEGNFTRRSLKTTQNIVT